MISVLFWLFCVCIWRESNPRSPGLGPCKRNVPLGTWNLGYFKPDFWLNGMRPKSSFSNPNQKNEVRFFQGQKEGRERTELIVYRNTLTTDKS